LLLTERVWFNEEGKELRTLPPVIAPVLPAPASGLA